MTGFNRLFFQKVPTFCLDLNYGLRVKFTSWSLQLVWRNWSGETGQGELFTRGLSCVISLLKTLFLESKVAACNVQCSRGEMPRIRSTDAAVRRCSGQMPICKLPTVSWETPATTAYPRQTIRVDETRFTTFAGFFPRRRYKLSPLILSYWSLFGRNPVGSADFVGSKIPGQS